ncbi:hypothetical protein MPSEU_000076800 [Mayamaea pseudoterrestris]|nr:hypothetical protein MPSEU_000076800 [Mayamaea pseudoterrestris]
MRISISMTLLSSLVASSTRAFSQSVAFRSQRSLLTVTARSLSSRGGGSEPMPHSDEQMPFYALGMNLAMQVGGQSQLKTLLEDDELDLVLEAFCDTIRGSNVVDARTVLERYGQDLNKILGSRTDNIVDRVKKDGEEYIEGFLAANDDAIKTASGMVYCEMTKGEGKQPSLGSTVEVHYHGTLTDGTVFDSSVDRGQTLSFPLGGVIKGWQEGLQMMREGGKATLVIPSDLAYGDAGSGEVIPPGATLKFEVELFSVQ